MRGRITKMPRNNTQIGSMTTSDWVLDFEPASERHIDPLMGWTSSSDMQSQVRLTFATKEAAIAIADRVLGDVRVWDMVDDVLVYEARNEPR